MSVQFGRWSFEGEPPAPGYLDKVDALLAPYGPDDRGGYSGSGIDILHRAFHTTRESRRESQPYRSLAGIIFVWDGRLDNRAELIRELEQPLSSASTDVKIVAAAYERWKQLCFPKLIGDWALSIWHPDARTLLLAKDCMGTRHLYYTVQANCVTWGTLLDPLVLLGGIPVRINEEYVAGWFSFFPPDLTPYAGIHSVPPSSYVSIKANNADIRTHWDFDPEKRVRHRNDEQYEEHFRALFSQSVQRRLRSAAPALAELSGGTDSSAIVCVADRLIALGHAETPRLDTVSYYDDSDPKWNERPYFTKIEEKRGRVGCHIDVGPQTNFLSNYDPGRFAAIPGAGARLTDGARKFRDCLRSQGNRVVLSGVGGDEVLGGVPAPTSELADLLLQARVCVFTRQLIAWALARRKPLLHLMAETLGAFLPRTFAAPLPDQQVTWLTHGFVKRHRAVLQAREPRLKILGSLPSFQQNLNSLEVLRRQMSCTALASEPPYEKRYPYLDRDLLEFLYSIPREQLLRPRQRRSLMRRALAGLVPSEVLQRKSKAFVTRAPIAVESVDCQVLLETARNMVVVSAGIVEPKAFVETLQRLRQRQEVPMVPLLRTLAIETWLRSLQQFRLLPVRPRLGSDRSLLGEEKRRP